MATGIKNKCKYRGRANLLKGIADEVFEFENMGEFKKINVVINYKF